MRAPLAPVKSVTKIDDLTVDFETQHPDPIFPQEQTNLPMFRRSSYFGAYTEGWGLYSEWLGEEMGIYRTPYERFGKLSYEMWRAVRLVVDTGIHHYGWTRQQAVDYLAGHTALSLREVNTEIDRYISWPGQALAYKIGQLKLLALRQRVAVVAQQHLRPAPWYGDGLRGAGRGGGHRRRGGHGKRRAGCQPQCSTRLRNRLLRALQRL